MLHVPISMLVYWRVTISNHRKWGFFHRFNLIWAINYYLRLFFLLVAPQDELCGWITCEKSHSWTPPQASKMLIFNQTWRKSEAQISFVSRIFPLNMLKCPVFFLGFPMVAERCLRHGGTAVHASVQGHGSRKVARFHNDQRRVSHCGEQARNGSDLFMVIFMGLSFHEWSDFLTYTLYFGPQLWWG
jgi:hypothetical protein